MKKIISLCLLTIGLLPLGGCSLSGTPTDTNTTTTTTVSTNTVNIQNLTFSPTTLTVQKGTTVTWTNNDSAPHQIKADAFNSSQLAKGQSFSFTFNTVGTFDYSCSIHPSMLGKIVVE
ncbi:MAG: cupredoxin family copper-binding protein [Patescibacteria group bacterium]|jgi:plastocyanin